MTLISGIESAHFDRSVRLQDDLFLHVNGTWLKTHDIPADRARSGAFTELSDKAELDVKALIETCAEGHDTSQNARQIADLYTSFMDASKIAQRGLEPLRPLLQRIADAADLSALTRLLGELQSQQLADLFGFSVFEDKGDSTRYTIYVAQSGLGLPDEAYYREESHAATLASYEVAMARLFTITGVPADQAAKSARLVVEFETKVAALHWTAVENRDQTKTYNPTNWAGFTSSTTGIDLPLWLEGLGQDQSVFESVCLYQPSFFNQLDTVWNADNLAAIRAWLSFHIIHGLAPYLTDELVEANFDFFGRTLSGTPVLRERWKRGVQLCESSVGDALGQLYVAKHFPEGHKAKMDVLVDNLLEAYRVSIADLPWMTEETRIKALEKLTKFKPYVGYPNQWRDYSQLEVSPDDLIGNVLRVGVDSMRRNLDLLGKPIQSELWHMTPQTVNAYYNPVANSIVFPAAILQPPFFSAEADDAVNYGSIGAVIGHEIGHGFDDQGSRFDGDGNLKDWWTQVDRDAFEARTKALIDQYNAYTPAELLDPAALKDVPSSNDKVVHVNGELTIGENIGDLGGLGIAVQAYELALNGSPAPDIDGYTGLQRVFIGWAQAWRVKARPAESLRLLATDPHSPAEFRCNGIVKNLDSFYRAFDVKDGDDLYLAPEQRVVIW